MSLAIALTLLQTPVAAIMQTSAVTVVVHGTVKDQTGLPIAGALVFVDGRQTSADTDSSGRFTLAIDAQQPSTLIAFSDGFEQASVVVDPRASNTPDPIVFVLTAHRVSESVTVTAVRPATPASAVTMRPLDVVRTPGAQGDLMRALQMLPGVGQPDEGAGLYVRGGDTSEVLVLLDDAVIFHPYRQETPGGGYFGRVEPFLLEGLSFSTGGFSARYGDALSAVLDLHGLPRPETSQAAVTFGLAGASMSASKPIGDNAGIRVSGNRSFPGLLFAINGEPYTFNPPPRGWDLNGSFHYKSATAGTFKLFAMTTGDQVGIDIASLSFAGLLKSTTASWSSSLHWEKSIDGRWLTTATLGVTRYTRGVGVGVLDLDTTDTRGSWRATSERAMGSWTFRIGADGIEARTQVDGTKPSHGGDFGGVGGSDPLRVRYRDRVFGAYTELERVLGRITLRAGARTDRFDRLQETAVDPRVSLSLRLTPPQRLSVAWGLYHQAPDASYFAFATPAGLEAMRAQHIVAGYEFGTETDPLHVRVETYRKTYESLPFESSPRFFTSTGYGSAHGMDLFAHMRRARVDVTGTYSYLDASRRWTPFEDFGRYSSVPDGTWAPAFGMPHNAHLMARLDMTRKWQTAAGWHISSGRLDTPVIGATSTPRGAVPIYGAIDSERLPHYERLDLTLTRLTHVIGWKSAILFAAVGNATQRKNFFEYAYSSDFSTRSPVTSAAPRVIYFGMTLTR